MLLPSTNPDARWIYAYHPICAIHGERPIDAGPRAWHVTCDLCGTWTDAFHPHLDRLPMPLPALGEPMLAGTH